MWFSKKNQDSTGSASVDMSQSGMDVADPTAFNKVINFCLYALVFLVPLFFLPFTFEFREFNKQALMFFGAMILLGAWVIRILTTRKMSWVKSPLDYILVVYGLVYLAASFYSVDKVSSFLGYYGRFTGGFISILSLIVLYYVVVNNVRSEKTVKGILKFLTAGIGLTLIYSLLQILGLYILPGNTHNQSFNPIGTLGGLAIFAAISLVFFQWMTLGSDTQSKSRTWVSGIFSLIALVILFLINSFVAWLILGLGMIIVLALTLTMKKEQSQIFAGIWKSMFVLLIAVLFFAFQFLPAVVNPRRLVNINLPVEIQLSGSSTWTLVKNSLSAGSKKAIIGSGPGTVGIVYGGIKPENLNNTIVWNVNFDRASTEIANIAIETGILGLVAFELVSLVFLVYALRFLMRKSEHRGWMYVLGFFLLWLSLYLVHFFYFFNSTFYFLFWFSMAMAMAIILWKDDTEQMDQVASTSGGKALVWMLASLLVLAVLLVGVFFEAVVYGADLSYTAGVKALNNSNPDLARASDDFGQAIALNPYRDVYYIAYGQSLVFRIEQEVAKQTPNTDQIKTWLISLISAGQQAVQISPEKSSNWSSLAQFYADIRTAVAGADPLVFSSLQKAIDKDPSNPALHYQLALAYSAAAQIPATATAPAKVDLAMMKQAETELNKAIQLKPDLAVFYIQLARVYEVENRLTDAKKMLDGQLRNFLNNPDLIFEDGRVTFNQNNLTDAEILFKAVISLVPNYANAHYSLGLLYQQKGDKNQALAEFEATSKIVGPNATVDKAISDLKAANATSPPTK